MKSRRAFWSTGLGLGLLSLSIGCSQSSSTVNGGGGVGGENYLSSQHATVTAGTQAIAVTSTTGGTCGNGVCEPGENDGNCCNDCGCEAASECAEPVCTGGVCQPGFFPAGSSCVGGNCDGSGNCIAAQCGDGTCNGTESSSNCCIDCPCLSGMHCAGNLCQPDASSNG